MRPDARCRRPCASDARQRSRRLPPVGDHRRDEEVARIRHQRGEERVRPGARPLDEIELASPPGLGDDRVGRAGRAGLLGNAAGRQQHDVALDRAEDHAPREAEPICQAIEDDAGLEMGSATSSSRAPTSTSAWRSARRCRSSRSFIAEKIDVASAKSQNDVTFRTGMRSKSIARPGITSTGGTRAASRVQHDEEQERVPQRDLQPGAVRRQQRDRDEVEVDEESQRALRRLVMYIAYARATPSTRSASSSP